MKYSDDFITPATKYDLVIESIAREDYFIWVKTNHHSLTVEETGLFVFIEFPFLVANPNGRVHSTYHGRSLLEINCPSNHKESVNFGMQIQLALQRKHEDQFTA